MTDSETTIKKVKRSIYFSRIVFLITLFSVLGLMFLALSSLKVITQDDPKIIAVLSGLIASVIAVITMTNYLAPREHDSGQRWEKFKRVMSLLSGPISIYSLSKLGIEKELYEKIINEYKKDEHQKKVEEPILSEVEKEEIISAIQNGIEKRLISEASEDFIKRIEKAEKSNSLNTYFLMINKRLKDEVIDQSKRGALNLSIGIVTAFIGIVFLIYSVIKIPTQGDVVYISLNFIPRLSIVFLIEIFAYFFLKLYKSSLDEIKYFQNEITNIESKYLAIKILNDNSSPDVFLSVVGNLMNTERNYILQKGQSTVPLEREKYEREQNMKLIGILEKFSLKK
ncbi:hypothetical protein [Yersinia aldovae]|uniref:hypothetical protein n=1 Tax=Yersinia aldovae TaxID=29483 RepID=UPI001643D99C|nr:hypothetical protein [Yersinia aldovae]EKN4745494.1 hypothetical protein [Yersinia enterocolitica]